MTSGKLTEKQIAVRALRKMAYRKRGTGFESVLNDEDKAVMLKLGLVEWVDQCHSYLLLTDAGRVANQLTLDEKRLRQKLDRTTDQANGYRQVVHKLQSEKGGLR